MRRFIIPVLMFFLSACGSGGDTSKTMGAGTGAILYSVSFAPDSAPASMTVSAAYNETMSTTDETAIDISADDIKSDSLFAAAFDVNFNGDILEYAGYKPGTYFEDSGNTGYLVETEQDSSGRLVISVSNSIDDPAVSGSGRIVTLRFKIKTSGTSKVSFSRANLIDNSGIYLKKLKWIGGELTIG